MNDDYFINHARARRLPWSLYHRPIEEDLQRFLRTVTREREAPEILVIGCGLMQELDDAPEGTSFTLVDVDPRVLDAVLARRDGRVAHGVLVSPDVDDVSVAVGSTFDAVYAKEVIEHVIPWASYLAGIHRVLRPGGRVWLSTPNYGEPWLPMLERTALEVVARLSGYTRRNIHPSRFSARTLAAALEAAHFTDVHVRPIAKRLALAAWGRR